MRYLSLIYPVIVGSLALASLTVAADPPSTETLRKALSPSPQSSKSKSGVKMRGIPSMEIQEMTPPEPPTVQLQEISFEFNSAELTTEARQTLDNLAAVINESSFKTSRFKLIGHTDSIGGSGFNLVLSAKRAKSAQDYLIRRYHIEANRLLVEGKGFSELADPEHPDSAINRRVQVTNLGQVE